MGNKNAQIPGTRDFSMSNTTEQQRPQDKPGLRFLGKLNYLKACMYTDGGTEKREVGLGKTRA